MEAEKQSLQVRNGIIFGLFTAGALIAYFVVMRMLGLADNLWMRFFNMFILLGGVIWSVNRYVRLTENNYNWFNTLGNGCLTVIVGSGIFCVFMGIELSIDKELMAVLHRDAWFGDFLTPITAAFALYIEQLAAGFILSFMLLSYVSHRRGGAQTTPGTTDVGKTVHHHGKTVHQH
jgi:hypothetical protein